MEILKLKILKFDKKNGIYKNEGGKSAPKILTNNCTNPKYFIKIFGIFDKTCLKTSIAVL